MSLFTLIVPIGAETTRIIAVFRSIPAQLAKSNHKFQYRVIKSGARVAVYESSLNWVKEPGVVIICHRTREGRLPLSVHEETSHFKLYMTDTGLLFAQFGIPAYLILQRSSQLDIIKGALTENYVYFARIVNGYIPYYWELQGNAEEDFVIQNKSGDIILIEVKSSENVRSKSLAQYAEYYHPRYAIRISTKNFGFDNNIQSVPLVCSTLHKRMTRYSVTGTCSTRYFSTIFSSRSKRIPKVRCVITAPPPLKPSYSFRCKPLILRLFLNSDFNCSLFHFGVPDVQIIHPQNSENAILCCFGRCHGS